MLIAVCVTQAGQLADDARFTEDGMAVHPDHLDMGMNEWDAYAIEEAIRSREIHGGETVALGAGGPEAVPALRRALAMGIDRAVHVTSPSLSRYPGDPFVVADALASALGTLGPDLVLTGMQTSDGGTASTGPAVAALMDLPVETCVVAIDWHPHARRAVVRRELEGGDAELREVVTPAVLTIQSGINQPRYATFRAIRQAEQAEIVQFLADESRPGALGMRLRVPAPGHRVELIGGDAREVASRIALLVREHLR